MKDVSYWQQFMQSGKVEDYLRFKTFPGEHEDTMKSSGKMCAEDDMFKGEYPHAGFYNRNGDDTKGSAYRGI